VFEFLINGKLVTVSTDGDDFCGNDRPVDEMAINGSEFYNSTTRPIGAILLASEESELSVVGCFFRIDNYLVTAKHVANAVSSGSASVFLTNIVGDTKQCKVNQRARGIDKSRFEIDNNLIVREMDVFAIELTRKEWSQLGITSVSTKKQSMYNQTVSAVGFIGGVLKTSNGKTLKGSGIDELWHTASTNKGFSGSPLFCGSNVVGIHVSASKDNNVAVRMEQILFSLPKRSEESDLPESGEHKRSYKFRGSDVEVFSDDEFYHFMDKNGRVYLGFDDDYMNEEFMYDEDRNRVKTKREEFDEEDEDRPRLKLTRTVRGVNIPPASKKVWGYDDEAALAYSELEREKPVHCGSTPKPQVEVVEYFAQHADELVKLGYDASKYAYPEMNAELELKSVKNHLELFHKNHEMIKLKVEETEKDRVAHLLLTMLPNNKFEPDIGYKTVENIVDIIDSSAVKDAKSPGQPYQADGLPLNKNVLEKFTKKGFAEKVLKDWNDDFQLKCFLKAEPNKINKLQKGMPRFIVGFPLHKMVKHQAIAKNMLDAAVSNWDKSPIKYGFTPSLPGHIEHLVRVFKGRAVVESDKTNWEYSFYKYLFEICQKVVDGLSVQPAGMSDDEYAEFKRDLHEMVDEIMNAKNYRCTNGQVFVPTNRGAMKSGSLLTIFLNSMAQLALDILIKIKMGLTNEQILSDDHVLIAGGDDVLQSFPVGFDLEKYKAVALSLGHVLSDFKEHKSFDGCEFFSHEFKRKNGIWQYFPVRFTKHIAKLNTTKLEDLPGALISHMTNYCWDDRKFGFLDRMYKDMRKTRPDLFTLGLIRDKQYLRYKCKGMECDV